VATAAAAASDVPTNVVGVVVVVVCRRVRWE
jgi:hypothetical protein